MKRTIEEDLRKVARFEVGLRHELFLALQVATDPAARIHGEWQSATMARLPSKFHRAFAALGRAHALWVLVPDVFEPPFVGAAFADVVAALRAIPLETFSRRLFRGVLHDPRLTDALLAGALDVPAALRRTKPKKREWLTFMGLYPPDPGAPLVQALELLRTEPAELRAHVVEAMTSFWTSGFDRTWETALPSLEAARAEKERLFAVCGAAEFMERALVRVEVDEAKRVLRAVRGGYELATAKLDIAYFVPSMFNDRRHWAVYDEDEIVVAHFPLFDPALAPVAQAPATAARASSAAAPALDPALVFRALGDATRFAIATLLAAQPRAAADVCRVLGLSRATLSHHIHELRAAGLLAERADGARVLLTLRRDVLERLSEATVTRLFGAAEPTLPTTRRKKP